MLAWGGWGERIKPSLGFVKGQKMETYEGNDGTVSGGFDGVLAEMLTKKASFGGLKQSLRMLVSAGLAFLLLVSSAQAQQPPAPPPPVPTEVVDLRPPPVMKNVFFNVAWGSLTGAVLGLAGSVISAENPSQPVNARRQTIAGATYGGVIGLGLGLYLVFSGITFNIGDASPPPAMFVFKPAPNPQASKHLQIDPLPHAQTNTPWLNMQVTQTSRGQTLSLKAKVFSLRF